MSRQTDTRRGSVWLTGSAFLLMRQFGCRWRRVRLSCRPRFLGSMFLTCYLFLCQRWILGQLLAVEVADDSGHVSLSLIIRRHAAVLVHTARTCIVGGQRFHHVEVVLFQQPAQISCPAFDVGIRIKWIGNSEL